MANVTVAKPQEARIAIPSVPPARPPRGYNQLSEPVGNRRLLKQLQQAQAAEQPGLKQILGSALGQGLAEGATSGIEGLMQQREQNQYNSVIDQALQNVDASNPNAVVQAIRRADIPREVQNQYLQDYILPIQIQKAMGTQTAAAKPNAALENAKYKNFNKRLEKATENAPEELGDMLEDYGQTQYQNYLNDPKTASQAANLAMDDIKKQTNTLKKISAIPSPNALLNNMFKVPELRKSIKKMVKENNIPIEQMAGILKEKGYSDEEIEVILSDQLTPDVIDYFIKNSGGNPKLAKSFAKKAGFEVP